MTNERTISDPGGGPGRAWSRCLRVLRRSEAGQSAFEFVLVLPFFITFMLALTDMGILMYEYVSVSNAVREGARYASVNCPGGADGCKQTTAFCPAEALNGVSDVRQRVINRSGKILSCSDTFAISWVDTVVLPSNNHNFDRGDTVVVRVVHNYPLLFFPYTIPVVSCASMQLELQDPAGATASNLPVSITGC